MAAFELEPEKVARLINERIPHRRQTAHGERAGQDDFFEEIPGTSFLTLGNAVLVVLALAILVGVVGQQR
jgi:hypothetical protein